MSGPEHLVEITEMIFKARSSKCAMYVRGADIPEPGIITQNKMRNGSGVGSPPKGMERNRTR